MFSAGVSIVKINGKSQTSSLFLGLYLSIFFTQITYSFSQASSFGEEGLAKRAIFLQRIGDVVDYKFGNFPVRVNEVCSLVKLLLSGIDRIPFCCSG